MSDPCRRQEHLRHRRRGGGEVDGDEAVRVVRDGDHLRPDADGADELVPGEP